MNKNEANITVFDNRETIEMPQEIMNQVSRYDIEYHFGKNSLEYLHGFDMIFRSPSCMPNIKELEEEKKRGAIITSEIEMLMKLCPGTIIRSYRKRRKNNHNNFNI